MARVLSHLQEVGPFWLARKALSRASEVRRNDKFVSIGIGRSLKEGTESASRLVCFVAPCHPRAVERIVLPIELTSAWYDPLPDCFVPGEILLAEAGGLSDTALRIAGWSAYSGVDPSTLSLPDLVNEARRSLAKVEWARATTLPTASDPVTTRVTGRTRERRPSAVLFGYGHYARTIVMKGVSGCLSIGAIHEIDPTLIPRNSSHDRTWDTSPHLDRKYDAVLVAGFHHTHAPLATRALELGAAAVIEKPVATDRSQLGGLLDALARGQGRMFSGFHKRYSPLTGLALQDLDHSEGAPIDYSAVVFEEPLPQRHWYRWPNSKSRIVSNACHWLDHFLYVNDFSRPTGVRVVRGGSQGESVSISVQLQNGAFCSISLSDTGSVRTGVQGYIELRSRDRTVYITNGSKYLAEDSDRVLRRTSINKMASYETMYREIASRIAAGGPGDSVESVETSARLTLDAEAAFLDSPLQLFS